jgi:hypothetical protein
MAALSSSSTVHGVRVHIAVATPAMPVDVPMKPNVVDAPGASTPS